MKPPKGATHFLPQNDLDYNPRPTFYKWGFLFRGPESCRCFYGWFNWHNDEWCRDTSFCDRFNKMKSISEYEEQK